MKETIKPMLLIAKDRSFPQELMMITMEQKFLIVIFYIYTVKFQLQWHYYLQNISVYNLLILKQSVIFYENITLSRL